LLAGKNAALRCRAGDEGEMTFMVGSSDAVGDDSIARAVIVTFGFVSHLTSVRESLFGIDLSRRDCFNLLDV
jgi:hypothetical protein